LPRKASPQIDVHSIYKARLLEEEPGFAHEITIVYSQTLDFHYLHW